PRSSSSANHSSTIDWPAPAPAYQPVGSAAWALKDSAPRAAAMTVPTNRLCLVMGWNSYRSWGESLMPEVEPADTIQTSVCATRRSTRGLAEARELRTGPAGDCASRGSARRLFAVGPELVHQRLACAVESDHLHAGAVPAQLQHHPVEGGDGGGVPEVGVGKVDDHARRGVQVVEAVGELHRAGEEHLAPHAVGAAAVGGVLVLDVQHRA